MISQIFEIVKIILVFNHEGEVVFEDNYLKSNYSTRTMKYRIQNSLVGTIQSKFIHQNV